MDMGGCEWEKNRHHQQLDLNVRGPPGNGTKKEFEAGPKCQRSLCEECYKIKRRKNKTETMKKLRCGHQ